MKVHGPVIRIRALLALILIFSLIIGFFSAGLPPQKVYALSPNIVISQVYGGGGNGGGVYTNDFIELFNRGSTTVSLSGWSIQYTSATGTGNFGSSTTLITELSDTIAPGQYYLVQEAAGANVIATLPAPDITDSTPINMSGTGGKVALVNTTASLGCNGGSTPCSAAQLAQIVDLVGWDGADFYETSPAPATSNPTAILRNSGGCAETDNNGADFTAAAPTPRNTASSLNFCTVDAAPNVASTTPANGTAGVPLNSDITVTFSEPVNVSASWFTLVCSISGTHTATVSGGPNTFTLNPDSDFVESDVCTLSILANQVSDQDSNDPPDNMAADFTAGFTVMDVCALPYTAIHNIQGSGATAAITGAVTTQGVVVGDYEGPSPALRGFFIQALTGDADPATSDGIFVFEANDADTVNLGDVVRITGIAGENQGQTQVSAASILACGVGTVVPVDVTLPFIAADYPERYEGMLVRLPQTLYVTEHFQLGRFGQVVMSSDGRLQQPTNVVAPGAPALVLQAQNNLNRIIIDDASQVQNPDPILFGRGGNPLSTSNTLRGGDTATGIVGVMNYTWAGNSASPNAYRVRPLNALGGSVNFEPWNPRPALAPEVGGSLKVASTSLFSFFNTFGGDNCTLGVGGSQIDCHGADSADEFARQWPKTVASLVGMNADIIGFTEMENDGYGTDSAIQFLVDKLNEATAPGTYAFIDADAGTGQVNALGIDAIKVGLFYKTAVVTPVGQTAVLSSVAFVNGGDLAPRGRPALAQAFEQNSNKAIFIVAINHFKSKGSACEAPDAGDGQGNCNIVRVNAANALTAWLATNPTGIDDPDILIIGDLNSYAKEDPITAIQAAGYTNLISTYSGPDAYSYVFDGQWGYLEQALGSASLENQVTGAAFWHVNADEPSVLDYNTNFKSAGQLTTLYEPDEFRTSDHDPILIGLDITLPEVNILYNGDQTVILGSSFTPQAQLTGSYISGVKVCFFLDSDPTTGEEGEYVLGWGYTDGSGIVKLDPIDTSLWLPGIYQIGVRECDDRVEGDPYHATLTVASPGDAATGGGWYTLSSSGRINFGFIVNQVPNDPAQYKGQILLINNGKWRLKGTLSSYVSLDARGSATGTGKLYQWDAAMNGGIGGWSLTAENVEFTISFADLNSGGGTGSSKKTVTPDTFGINIKYAVPVNIIPLPNSTPASLKGGNISIKISNVTPPASPPGGGKKK